MIIKVLVCGTAVLAGDYCFWWICADCYGQEPPLERFAANSFENINASSRPSLAG